MLEAAERQGFTLEYSCRTGRCSTCRAQVASGSTKELAPEVGLTEGECAEGWILTCVRAATSDVVLSVDSELDAAMAPVRTVPCRIRSIERLSGDVLEVVLRIPPTVSWDFRAGQHMEIQGPLGVRRSYSMANANAEDDIRIHVREVAQGVFSRYWFSQAAPGDLLRFRGPLGTFFLRGREQSQLVFLATGTGIAPVIAMLEDLASREPGRAVVVYFGGRNRSDLYWSPAAWWPDGWQFKPVLSRPDAGWTGRVGYVQNAMLADGVDLSVSEIYATGSDAMVHSVRTLLADLGHSPQEFHADAFVSSAPTKVSAT